MFFGVSSFASWSEIVLANVSYFIGHSENDLPGISSTIFACVIFLDGNYLGNISVSLPLKIRN
jgi:hypothetical protein